MAVRLASSQTSMAITQRGNHIPEHHVVPTEDEMAADPQLAGLGYPQMAPVSRQLRPAKGWWDNQERCVLSLEALLRTRADGIHA